MKFVPIAEKYPCSVIALTIFTFGCALLVLPVLDYMGIKAEREVEGCEYQMVLNSARKNS